MFVKTKGRVQRAEYSRIKSIHKSADAHGQNIQFAPNETL